MTRLLNGEEEGGEVKVGIWVNGCKWKWRVKKGWLVSVEKWKPRVKAPQTVYIYIPNL